MSAPYEFDRYVGGQLMAEGVCIHYAASEDEARAKAFEMYRHGARPGEMEKTRFVLITDGQTSK